MYVKSYKELIVWQKAMSLCEEIYKLTALFPQNEIYGIVLQIKRAAISIASNIAEGYGRSSQKDFNQFLCIAYGSLLELETQLLLSKRLKLVKEVEFISSEQLVEEISKMLHSMIIKFRLNAKR
jgi:four helix bundle protein